MPNIATKRRKSERWMPDDCTIERWTETTDEEGRQIETWVPVAQTKCRRIAMSGREIALSGRLSVDADAMAHLPFGTDLRDEDMLTVGEKSYNVTYVSEQSDALSAHVEALITRAQ